MAGGTRQHLPYWWERFDEIVAELLAAASDPRVRRSSWRHQYGALVAAARTAEELKPRARTHALIRVARRIPVVEGRNLRRGARLDSECAMELAISRALPGKHKGCCAGCFAERRLPEDEPQRQTRRR